mgnify:CR=1 FL=1
MTSPNSEDEQVKNLSQARYGNKCGVSLKTQESKDKAFKSYCDHIAKGRPKYGWHYVDDDGNHCCWETMDKHIAAGEFDTNLLKAAQSKSFQRWFERGEKLVDGEIKGGSPKTWETIMRNKFQKKYGWDKDQDPAGTGQYLLTVTNKKRPADQSEPIDTEEA